MKRTAEIRFKNTVKRLIAKDVYPSPRAINQALGRGDKIDNINGAECNWRRQICFELGFKLKGFNQLDVLGLKFEMGPWHTKRRMQAAEWQKTKDEC